MQVPQRIWDAELTSQQLAPCQGGERCEERSLLRELLETQGIILTQILQEPEDDFQVPGATVSRKWRVGLPEHCSGS